MKLQAATRLLKTQAAKMSMKAIKKRLQEINDERTWLLLKTDKASVKDELDQLKKERDQLEDQLWELEDKKRK